MAVAVSSFVDFIDFSIAASSASIVSKSFANFCANAHSCLDLSTIPCVTCAGINLNFCAFVPFRTYVCIAVPLLVEEPLTSSISPFCRSSKLYRSSSTFLMYHFWPPLPSTACCATLSAANPGFFTPIGRSECFANNMYAPSLGS